MHTFKFRLYPNKYQINKLWEHSIELTKLHNYFLDKSNKQYEINKKICKRFDNQKELKELKKDNIILKEIHSQVLQQIPLNLDKSFQNFFRNIKINGCQNSKRKDNKPKFHPKFHSSRNFTSICYPQIRNEIQDNYFVTKSYGKLKFHKHTEILGKIKSANIIFEDNKWYISFVTTYTKKIKQIYKNIVGIDLGITNFVYTSNNEIIKNKNSDKYFDKIINKLKSRRDIKCKKYSKQYRYLTLNIRKLYEMKKRHSNDFLHKVSRTLANKYDTIIVEDLKSKQMSESKIHNLNRENRNASFGKFISFLEYKTSNIIKVDPRNTSKRCCLCGKLHKMPLNKRTLKCNCDNILDRDLNAAINILCQGLASLGEILSKSDIINLIQEAPTFMWV